MPLEDRRKKFPSPDTYFVVWVEIENTGTAARTYRRWQPVATGECTLRLADGTVVSPAYFPPGAGREWFGEFNQELPPGGPAVLDSLAFGRPDPAGRGDLSLALDAARVGGTGRLVFTIPRAAWARP